MLIVTDFDGVMVDHISAACRVWNIKYRHPGQSEVKPEDIYNYGFQTKEGISLCPGLDHKELFRDPLFFEVLKPTDDAVEVYERLSRKHRLIILTTGTFGNIGLKAPWIHKNFPFIDEAIFVKTKNKMDKSFFRGDFMKEAVFIDDSSNCLDSVNARFKICFGPTKGWNEDWMGVRVHSMTELEIEIDNIERKI
jgi:5'(3')-deoxyribonucleotidase